MGIDFDNISQRILAMPMPPRRYVALDVGKAGALFAVEAPLAAPGQPAGLVVHRYDLKARRTDVAASGVQAFKIARSGDKMLTRQGDNWFIRNVPPLPPAGCGATPTPPPAAAAAGNGQLNIANLDVRINPLAEWKQMYHEAWRIERDFFYDPNFHGLDLKAAEKRYEPFVERHWISLGSQLSVCRDARKRGRVAPGRRRRRTARRAPSADRTARSRLQDREWTLSILLACSTAKTGTRTLARP